MSAIQKATAGLMFAALVTGPAAAQRGTHARPAHSARSHQTCEQRIEQATAQLQRAVSRYGANSRQASQKRAQLARTRDRCRIQG